MSPQSDCSRELSVTSKNLSSRASVPTVRSSAELTPVWVPASNAESRPIPKLALWITAWYLISSVSNNISKITLGLFPFPITVSLIQSFPAFVGFLFLVARKHVAINASKAFDLESMVSMEWALRLRYIGFTHFLRHWRWGLVLGGCSIVGSTLHRLSLLYIHVSFVHTVKACQPFFAVLISRLWLGERFSRATYLSLIPIAAGVGIAAMAERGFHVVGFLASLTSSVILCSGMIASKNMMKNVRWSHKDKSAPLDKDTVFYFTSTYATVLLMILFFFTDLVPVSTFIAESTTPNLAHITVLVLTNSLLSTCQSYASLTVLSMVSSVSHAVVTCFKRIVVIMLAIAYFGNPITWVNFLGIGISTVGVFCYQLARRPSTASIPAVSSVQSFV